MPSFVRLASNQNRTTVSRKEGCRQKKYASKIVYYDRNPDAYVRDKENDRNRMVERRPDPEYRTKEAKYLADYCVKRSITYEALWKEIKKQ